MSSFYLLGAERGIAKKISNTGFEELSRALPPRHLSTCHYQKYLSFQQQEHPSVRF
jgi:hypothetical protein